MFLHLLRVERIGSTGITYPVPIAQLDSFCMRNFTNDAAFDDTLPVADGILEVGSLVPFDRLLSAMEDWFRRKRCLDAEEVLRITSVDPLRARWF